MRLSKIKRKDATHFYIIESFRNGSKVSSRIIKKLGSDKEICKKHNVEDAEEWAKKQVDIANAMKYDKKDKKGRSKVASGGEIDDANIAKKIKKSSSQYKGVEYVSNLYSHFGLDNFIKNAEVKNKCNKDNLNNLLFLLILDSLYFPNSSYLNSIYFKEGYFKDQQLQLDDLQTLYQLIADNCHFVIDTISDKSDIHTATDTLMFCNIELDKSLILPGKTNNNPYLGIMYDSYGVPITLLHSSFSNAANINRIKESLKEFGFVNIFSNGDTFGIENNLPQKASLKKFKRLSLKEAKMISQENLSINQSWKKAAYEQKSFMRGYSDFYYKKFEVPKDDRYVLVAIYSIVFDYDDCENKINITRAMLDNPQCKAQVKDNINNYIANSVYNNSLNGYRFYLLPKKMPVELVINFDFNHGIYSKCFNIVPYSNTGIIEKSALSKYTLASQIIYYISCVFAHHTIKNSNYYIGSIVELAFFLQILDSAAFSDQFGTYLEQLMYRLDK